MKQDVQHKAATIANNLRKAERQLATEERRNLRQLDKVEQMQKGLAEDAQQARDSLTQTERLKQRAQANFEAADKENAEEKRKHEQQVAQLEQLLATLQQELGQSKAENAKLKAQVQSSRSQDQERLRQPGGNPEAAALAKALKDARAKAATLSQEARQELGLKAAALQRFAQAESQGASQRQTHARQLRDQEAERKAL